MKLVVEENGQPHELLLERTDHQVNATIDGRAYMLEVRSLPDGSLLILHQGRVLEGRVTFAPGNDDRARVSLAGREFEFTVRDPKRLAHQGAAAAGEGQAQLVAMMPGKVVGVLVEEGQEVEANQPILVVEAMKMQNEMRSPRAGVLRDVRVKTGDTVNSGDVLAVIE
jgi:biotin carboxyl carrier protein